MTREEIDRIKSGVGRALALNADNQILRDLEKSILTVEKLQEEMESYGQQVQEWYDQKLQEWYDKLQKTDANCREALLQVGKYRTALEKILRLEDATPGAALDAVWIAKDALLGTNHMEEPKPESKGVLCLEHHRAVVMVDGVCPKCAEKRKCNHKWAHIEDHHVICEKCKHVADLCWTCEAEKVKAADGRLFCVNCDLK